MSTVASIALVSVASPAMAADVYGPYPITLKGYSGDKTNSVSYSGQVGRQLLPVSYTHLTLPTSPKV